MAHDRANFQRAYRIGVAANKAGAWKKAFNAFRVAINEFPKSPDAFAGLGEACLGLKELDRALECFKLAARYSRGDISYMNKVADIQERQGQLADAARTYMAIGELFLKQRKLEPAVEGWERAIRLDPALLGAHKRLAMVFQRQNLKRDAVREYLAIARILQMRGDNRKALKMCLAAQRLDPNNEDVQTAIELIRYGEAAFAPDEEEEEVVETLSAEELAEADSLTETVRQMAAIFEAERAEYESTQQPLIAGPIDVARQHAQEQLAEEIFRDEDDATDNEGTLSKLERDAALGQGMDFESRGQLKGAITAYVKAIDGGLRLPAAYYTLGMLYLQNQQRNEAQRMLAMAAQDPVFARAARMVLRG
jgi:tetratricopeptide (TPR) repeat protein